MVKRSKGFTLIELLVSISIIGILLSIVAAGFVTAQKRGRDANRMGDLKAIQKSLEECYVLDKVYPAELVSGVALECGAPAQSVMNYVPSDPKDTDIYVYNYTVNASRDSYCLCTGLERVGSGNGIDAGGSGVCSFGAGDYQCVASQQ